MKKRKVYPKELRARVALEAIKENKTIADTGCGIAPKDLPHIYNTSLNSDHWLRCKTW